MNAIMKIFGWPLGWIMWLGYKIVPIYPLALVIFTLIVRAAMIPLSVKQQKNSVHMTLLKPKADAINKKYSDNRAKAQEEINKMYVEEGYNPASGCSGLLIQLPILYGLIDVIYRPITYLLRLPKATIENARQILEKVADISGGRSSFDYELRILGQLKEHKQEFINGIDGITGIGAEAYEKMTSIKLDLFGMNLGEVPTWAFNLLILIPVFSFLTALLSSIISMKMQNDTTANQGKGCMYGMMFGMPFLSAYFSFLVPAGVGFYWILGNVFAAAQSVILKKLITPEKVKAKLAEEKKKLKSGKKKKKKSMMEKMLEAQAAATADGAVSEKEAKLSAEQRRALEEAKRRQQMSDSEKLKEARRRYAEKYGDQNND